MRTWIPIRPRQIPTIKVGFVTDCAQRTTPCPAARCDYAPGRQHQGAAVANRGPILVYAPQDKSCSFLWRQGSRRKRRHATNARPTTPPLSCEERYSAGRRSKRSAHEGFLDGQHIDVFANAPNLAVLNLVNEAVLVFVRLTVMRDAAVSQLDDDCVAYCVYLANLGLQAARKGLSNTGDKFPNLIFAALESGDAGQVAGDYPAYLI